VVWAIEFENTAAKELAKLGKPAAARIVKFLSERIAPLENPRDLGQALKGSALGEFWKYRVGDYRLVCKIIDARITIVVVRVGNRREVYR
jgi:mRNA interferase RelE/StbE